MNNVKKASHFARDLRFRDIYNRDIAPMMEKFERSRKSKLGLFLFVICAIFFIALCILPMLSSDFLYVFSPFLVGGGIGLIFLSSFIFKLLSKKFGLELKQACLGKMLSLFGDIHWVSSNNDSDRDDSTFVSNAKLRQSGLFLDYNRRSIDDEFYGNWHGVDFKICETYLHHVSGSGKNRRDITIFNGVIIVFQSNKFVKNRTIVATKGNATMGNRYWSTVFGGFLFAFMLLVQIGFNTFGIIISIIAVIVSFIVAGYAKKGEEVLNPVTLEDPEFNKKFDVYSSDQIEARYLITPTFMERFSNLKTAFDSKTIKCSFFDCDKFMVAISTNKDLFELGCLNKSTQNPETVYKMYEELSSVLDMIDYFKLDEKTGV